MRRYLVSGRFDDRAVKDPVDLPVLPCLQFLLIELTCQGSFYVVLLAHEMSRSVYEIFRLAAPKPSITYNPAG